MFASLLCYLFWNMAVEVLGATRTSLFYYTLPPVSGVAAWLVLDEAVNGVQMLSGVIILAGIIFALYADRLTTTMRGAVRNGSSSEVDH